MKSLALEIAGRVVYTALGFVLCLISISQGWL